MWISRYMDYSCALWLLRPANLESPFNPSSSSQAKHFPCGGEPHIRTVRERICSFHMHVQPLNILLKILRVTETFFDFLRHRHIILALATQPIKRRPTARFTALLNKALLVEFTASPYKPVLPRQTRAQAPSHPQTAISGNKRSQLHPFLCRTTTNNWAIQPNFEKSVTNLV